MENRAYAIAVGIFTLVLGAGLVFAYWWIHGSRQASAEYVVVSSQPVSGLNTEATVRFRGVDVGKVTQISFDPASQSIILINISIAQSLRLSSESYAELRLQGLTGLAYIDVNDESPDAPQLPAGGRIPLRQSLVDRLIARGPALIEQLEAFLQNSNQLTVSANRLLTDIDTRKLNKTIANLEEASRKAAPAMISATGMFNNVSRMASAQNQEALASALESIRQSADEARPMMHELGQAAKAFSSTADQIALSASQLTATLEGETLPQLHTLTRSMDRSAYRFDQFIDFLEENPQSIIFGKPNLLPGPGEEGFTIHP